MSAPDLTIVMPVRDEGSFMARSLDAVLAQDYDGTIEVLVVDGASSDDTPTIVAERADDDPRIALIANPERIVPNGLNLAIARASGALLLRVDGHCEIPPDYATVCVERLLEQDAACVGGVLRTVGTSPAARAISLAQASPFGVGGASFRTGVDELMEVDTVAFGVYRTDHLRRLGGFDEDLVRNQDDELNLRLRQDGGRILLEPSVAVTYHSRATLRGLARQYRQYGWFKPLVLRKRGRLPSARSAAPAILVIGLVVATVLGGVMGGWPLALAPLAGYGAGLVIAAGWITRRELRALPRVAVALGALHLPYGIGFLGGLWRWRRARPTPVSVDDA